MKFKLVIDQISQLATIAIILLFSGNLLAAEIERESSCNCKPKWSPVSYEAIKNKWWITLEGHVSMLNDARDRSLVGDTFGYGIKAGYRWDMLGLFVQAEHNMWIAQEFDREVDEGAFNFGFGMELNYLGGYARTTAAIGPSVLIFDNVLDDAGSTGIFFDLRPIGLRWPITEFFVINLDPLAFTIVAPILDEVILVMVEYRTTLGFEFAI